MLKHLAGAATVAAALLNTASAGANRERDVALACSFTGGVVLEADGVAHKPRQVTDSYVFSIPASATALGLVVDRPIVVNGSFSSSSTGDKGPTLVVRTGAELRILEVSAGNTTFNAAVLLDQHLPDHSMLAFYTVLGELNLPPGYDAPIMRSGSCRVSE